MQKRQFYITSVRQEDHLARIYTTLQCNHCGREEYFRTKRKLYPWRWLRNNEWEFSWELVHCCVTHVTEQWWRQWILHVLGSFILARVTRQFIVRLILFWNGYCLLDWNSNPMFYANPLLQKTFNLVLIKLKKYLIAEGSSGSNGWPG